MINYNKHNKFIIIFKIQVLNMIIKEYYKTVKATAI